MKVLCLSILLLASGSAAAIAQSGAAPQKPVQPTQTGTTSTAPLPAAAGGVAPATVITPTVGTSVSIDGPTTVVIDVPAQLTVTVSSTQPLSSGRAVLDLPSGITAKPAEFEVPPGTTIYSRVVSITSAVPGENRIGVVVSSTSAQTFPAATAIVKFKVIRTMSAGLYLLSALIGVAIGYCVRLMMYVLKSVPAPAPAPVPPAPAGGGGNGGGQKPGPITTFVKNHYYVVDFTVTLVISFLVLIGLMTDGRAPDSVYAWYSALTAGAALGLLTNSDLILRVR